MVTMGAEGDFSFTPGLVKQGAIIDCLDSFDCVASSSVFMSLTGYRKQSCKMVNLLLPTM
jgi:hypothetical protein